MSQAPAARSDAETSTELAMRRTGMSFQRTRMSADRTLMSEIRTSLSLISFGFTIYQIFRKLKDAGMVLGGISSARNFGLTLVLLGVAMLTLGIVYHLLFMLELREQREQMRAEQLIHAQSHFPASLTLIIAVTLLLVGIAAAASIVFRNAPFS